jgi:hypothetical protein
LNNDTIVKVGLELVDACWNTYAGTAYVVQLKVGLTYDSLLLHAELELVLRPLRLHHPSPGRMVLTLAILMRRLQTN